MKKAWVLRYPISVQRRLRSGWADAQAELSLCWAHSHFVDFVMSWLIYFRARRQTHATFLGKENTENEPCHEIMALFVLRKLILQTRMRSHPVGAKCRTQASCVRTAKTLARLRRCAGLPEPSLVTFAMMSTIAQMKI